MRRGVQVAAGRRTTAVLAGLGALLVLATLGVCGAGWALGRPAPAAVGAPPADLGARAIEIRGDSGRAVVRGWYAPGRTGGGAVLLLHPVRANRLAMLDRARLLHRAGYAVLLVDLQAHGESPGAHITFGARESADAHAALDTLRALAPGERAGAIGVSLGGASALLGPAPLDVDALVLESVYPTIDDAVADRLRIRFGALGPPLAPLLTMQLRPRIGVTPTALRPVDAIARLRAPLLLIAGTADRHTTIAEARRLYAAAPTPKSMWEVRGAAHQDLLAYAPAEYGRRVLSFLDSTLRRPR